VIDDHNLVSNHEIFVVAPSRIDLDECLGDRHHMHGGRHYRALANRKVHAIHSRYVVAGENGFPDPGALIRAQRHISSLSLSRNAAGLTLLSLALLGLIRLS
jgi:hypothetical protein